MSEKCLIVGLGQIGMGYDLAIDPAMAVYTHARAFSMHPAFELVGAVDAAEAQRSLFWQHYGKAVFDNLDLALGEVNPDIVVIATPTATHSKILQKVLGQSKPKAILCEKPLAYGLAEARKMVEACECSGVKLFVNYIRRADPGAIEIKKHIESNSFVAPIKGCVWYSKGFLHNGSHLFNLLEFWLGGFVRATVLDPGRLWDEQDPEPDVQVEFERGKVVFQAVWEEAFSHHTLELLSPSGRLRYEQGGNSILWQATESDPNFSGYKILQAVPETIKSDMGHYQWNVINQLGSALAEKPHCLCTGRQALRTLEVMHQIISQR